MEVIIIGAGAAGLACAIQTKTLAPETHVTVLERLEVPGKKILATGNGRCNLSNTQAAHHQEILNFFETLGLKTCTDSAGRIYPYSLKAETVLHILLDRCTKLDIDIITDCTVEKIETGFIVHTDKGIYSANKVVVACGGKAQSPLGSNGSGYALLQAFGHTCTRLYPALVQLTSSSKYPRKVKGLRTRCTLTITLDGEPAGTEQGEVLFTDYGLSGIAAMNLSHIVSKNFSLSNPQKCCAVLDLVPDMDEDALYEHLKNFGSMGGILGYQLAEIIEKQAKGNAELQAKICKSWNLILTGTKGYPFAQITGGGIPCGEFTHFESNKTAGLYAVGEVLDVQFPCGGFNLNFAFHSGLKAAEKITESKKA